MSRDLDGVGFAKNAGKPTDLLRLFADPFGKRSWYSSKKNCSIQVRTNLLWLWQSRMPTTKTETIQAEPVTETEPVRTWVKAAQAGNRASFERLADTYYSAIYRMVYFRIRNRMDAEDITQDVFLKAYKGLGRLTDTSYFKAWLFQIAVNRVRDFQRRHTFIGLFKPLSNACGDMQSDQIQSPSPEPDELLRRQRFYQESEIFLARLTKIEKDIFTLRFFDHLQLREIATALQRSDSTVKTHLYRAVAKFKQDHALRDFLKGDQA